ncbi:uncharacterized protein Z519_12323 [Cladophialophora bantiana CBS 173.52]|uniref:Carboxylesterase family protein n=1 Tax=Cladophialophora bantiana (strain ATCC 10958 / CBS 173.52 / CDC B-1940 / NIH 8579) TaxID=1442370 RepID=A0A0D2EAC4_CLAB1|nr:uncharacterized protein Z519_12323 [Cladophialophora bantiana CBS 173.52]KIW87026.1 hypothetical protein Z519_12323 [Cladophialophora bantiana CBS 173.52]
MRMTRAALRAQAQEEPQLIYEDADANNNSLQDDGADANANQDLVRPPLKDITTEINPPTTDDPFTDEQTEATVMQKVKSRKKCRKAKNDKVENESSKGGELDEPQELQFEDAKDSHLSQSSEHKGSAQDTPITVSVEQAAVGDKVTVEAVDATLEERGAVESTSTPRHSHSGPPKTPKFDPSVHKAMDEVVLSAEDTVEDSFVEKITSRTPGRLQILLEESKLSDSYVDQIGSRTPRIEDSVEAIDALEDAIEKIAETLPALDELKIESPVKLRKTTPARINLRPNTPPTDPRKKTTGRHPAQTSRRPPQKAGTASVPAERPKLSATRASSTNPIVKGTVTTKTVKRPIIDGHKSRESSAQASAPPLSFSNSPVKKLANTTKKQVAGAALSTSRPGFVPAKSTKSPTRPKFSLPGDAVAAKLKVQREERMKREEETGNDKKVFKARPVPAKISRPSVVPRENKASQARMSIYATGGNKENVEPKPAAASQPKTRPLSHEAKPKTWETAKAKVSVHRTAASATPTKPRPSSIHLAAGQKSTITKEDVVQQRAKGKEVFERSKAEMERLDKERREKEDAARKARAEAAERGRQASREWAEKQKKKIAAKILAAKEKEMAGSAESVASSRQASAVASASS